MLVIGRCAVDFWNISLGIITYTGLLFILLACLDVTPFSPFLCATSDDGGEGGDAAEGGDEEAPAE